MSSGYQRSSITDADIEQLGFGPELDAMVAESLGVDVLWRRFEIPGGAIENIPSVRILAESLDSLRSVGIKDTIYDDQVPSFSEELHKVQLVSRDNWAWSIYRDSDIVHAVLVVAGKDSGAIEASATFDEGLHNIERAEALAMSRAIAKWGTRASGRISAKTVEIVMEALNGE